MREILFRGKRIDNGEWVCGSLSMEYFRECGCVMISPSADTCYKVAVSTVGQFTGLTDKNGKKIFEGDIVQFGNGRFVVEYYDCRMGFAFSGLFGRGCVAGFTMTDWEHLEVIGNIHDNPELLEVNVNAQ